MKKLILIALMGALGLTVAACGKKGDVNPPVKQEQPAGR